MSNSIFGTSFCFCNAQLGLKKIS